MDKKTLGVIGLMVFVGILIIVGTVAFSNTEQEEVISGNTAYVQNYFDKDQVIDVYVNLEQADYEDMLANSRAEEYKLAAVVVDGQKVENVGFRVKGNSSLNMVASTDSIRFSFKVDFDQYISGQSLAGLTKLNLNNSVSDPSYMREYLSYSLLNEMNVPTPAYCYANVYINGELIGLYLAVEGIEEPFLERYYGSVLGNLYKPEGQGSDLVYIDDQIDSYTGIALVTEAKNGSENALLTMLQALNEGRDLDKYLNVDEILRYFAVNTVMVNMDSYQGNLKHNYYLYEEDGVFSILPWDFNMSFGGFGMGGQGGQNSTMLYIDQPVSGTTLDERPLIGKLLEVDEYKALYHQYIEEFITEIFTKEKMKAEIDEIAEMIHPYLEQDPTKFYSLEQFEQAITAGTSSNVDQPINNFLGNITDRVSEGSNIQTDQRSTVRGEIPDFTEQLLDQNSTELTDQREGRMMQGENVIGLVDFINNRLENVQKQLTGELPSQGDSSQDLENSSAMWGPPGNRGGGIAMDPNNLGQGRPMPPAWEGKEPPEGMRDFMGNRELPPENPDNLALRDKNSTGEQSLFSIYVIGGAILLLTILTWLLYKKRTKYSI